MNKYKLLSATIVMTLSTTLASPLLAVPSLFAYQQASSAYEDAYINGAFNIGSGNREQANYNLDLSLSYDKVFSSADRNTALKFRGIGSRSRDAAKDAEARWSYLASASATVDNYFRSGSKGAFWYGRGEVASTKESEEKESKDIFSKLTIGVGYGRVVNVTPMSRAIRLIESLRANNSLSRLPSDDVYQNIAQIISTEDAYESKHGRDYQQYWISDIEASLKASGATNGALGSKATLKVYKVLVNERISTRKHGWLVRGGVGAVLSDYDGEKGKPALELGAEYHRPLGNQTQFSNEAIFTTALKDSDSSYVVNNTMSLTHEVSDVVDWDNKWLVQYNKTDGSDATTSNALSSAFNYELTNQLDFNITTTLTKKNDNIDNNGNDGVDKKITMGIQYRLK